MDAGALRRMDTSAAARCFIGPIIAYIFTREVFVQPDAQTLTPETMLATAVDVFLEGLRRGLVDCKFLPRNKRCHLYPLNVGRSGSA
jgi:hypothetical protein